MDDVASAGPGDTAALITCAQCKRAVDAAAALYTVECGCAFHPECYVPMKCSVHTKSPTAAACIPYSVCVLCTTSTGDEGACRECAEKISTAAVAFISEQCGTLAGVSIRQLYYYMFLRPWWPSFFAKVVSDSDINTDGSPSSYTHPYIAYVWCIVAIAIRDSDEVHIDTATGRVWTVGAWLESAFVKLPLKPYALQVVSQPHSCFVALHPAALSRILTPPPPQVTVLPEFKSLTISDAKALRLFAIYLTEHPAKIRLYPDKSIRRRTKLNIASEADLVREINAAEWSGVAIEDICKETAYAPTYIRRVRRAGKAVVHDRRVYSPRPWRTIKGLAKKLVQ